MLHEEFQIRFDEHAEHIAPEYALHGFSKMRFVQSQELMSDLDYSELGVFQTFPVGYRVDVAITFEKGKVTGTKLLRSLMPSNGIAPNAFHIYDMLTHEFRIKDVFRVGDYTGIMIVDGIIGNDYLFHILDIARIRPDQSAGINSRLDELDESKTLNGYSRLARAERFPQLLNTETGWLVLASTNEYEGIVIEVDSAFSAGFDFRNLAHTLEHRSYAW